MKQNNFEPLKEIRCILAKVCSSLFNIECNENHVIIDGAYADAVLRIAFDFELEACDCAQKMLLKKEDICLYDCRIIGDVFACGKYINIVFDEYFLRNIADRVIKTFPKTEFLQDTKGDCAYAIIRTHMLSKKRGNFDRAIAIPHVRKAFFEALAVVSSRNKAKQKAIVAKTWLEAERDICGHYQELGIVCDCICRLLCYTE